MRIRPSLRTISFLSAYIVLTCCGFSARAEDAKALLEQGKQALEANKFQAAIEAFDKVIELDPQMTEAYRERGWAKSRLIQEDQGFDDIEQAIKLDPKSGASYHTRALMTINLRHDYKAAILDLDTAIQLGPEDWKNFNVRGFCKLQLQQFEEAIPDLTKAIELNPKTGNPHQHRAECLYALGKYEQAVEDFEAGIAKEEKPDDRQYYLTAACHYVLQNYRKSIKYAKKAISRDNDDWMCFQLIGHCHYALKECQAAFANYDAMCKELPQDGKARHLRGLALWELDRIPEAQMSFAQAKALGYTGESK